jgi:polysaccharide pyruvyl transferase CsaB
MRFCLFAFIGSENLGDEAIFESVLRDLASLGPEEIGILSMNPARTRRIAREDNMRVLAARSTRATLSAVRRCDVFVCGGGGIFQDQTSIYNPSRYLARIQMAHALGKKVFVYGVSVGPLVRSVNRVMAGAVLKQAACITVRDEASRAELIALGVPAHKVHTTSDPVMNYSATIAAPEHDPARRKIVVCLRHWFDTIDWLPVSVVNALHLRSAENAQRYTDFVANMARVLDHLAADPKAELEFVPFWGERDTRVHRDVLARMTKTERCHVVGESPSPERANAIIGDADLVVGMRLHSLIFAVANARPFFAIDYSKKVGDFLSEVLPGRVPLVSASPKDLDAARAIAQLDRLETASPFDDDYRARVADLKRKERQNVALLRELLTASGLR